MSAVPNSIMNSINSPKLNAAMKAQWYKYYAGYSRDFVASAYRAMGLTAASRVLDPWIGSGTTLGVAAANGSPVYGLDLNPAMSIIAKGRLIAFDTEPSIPPLANEILRYWRDARPKSDDLLSNWFDAKTGGSLRGLIKRIDTCLIINAPTPIEKATRMSSLAAFFYVAVFEVVSGALKSYGSRNPTWLKRGTANAGTVTMSRTEIRQRFEAAIERLLTHVKYNARIAIETRNDSVVRVGDSREQPFDDATCDAVITSPPYLTRLDYVVGHLAELAVLGLRENDIETLRRRMIGTPTMGSGTETIRPLGTHTEALLKEVENHESYAAGSYYAPNFKQYFQGMTASFGEIQRICKPASPVMLVVQDSRFKNIHLDLAAALSSMLEESGWTTRGRRDFNNVRTMAFINTRAHELARTTKPIESVLWVTTPS